MSWSLSLTQAGLLFKTSQVKQVSDLLLTNVQGQVDFDTS